MFPLSDVNNPANSTLALILAGGRGARLAGLTNQRAKPAVHFGGKYRLIDFALSNCLNSGIGRIGVVTQYMSHPLNRHIQQGWALTAADGQPLIELLPAQQRTADQGWYRGTANAIYQNLDIIRAHRPRLILVLAGDHVYQMDYRPMLAAHAAYKADMTIGALEYARNDATHFGVLGVDENNRVERFAEKPLDPEPLPTDSTQSLVSMGIYVFNAEFLYDRLEEMQRSASPGHDFGNDVIPRLISDHAVYSYPFRRPDGQPGYWRDVGTLDSFWRTNLELVDVVPELNLYSRDWPLRTTMVSAPPSKFVFDSRERCGAAVNSMIADGCIISGALISRSVVFSNVTVNEFTEIIDSVVLPDCVIGPRCRIRKAVLDRYCQLPAGTEIGYDRELDTLRFDTTADGVVLVTPSHLQHLKASRAA